MKIVSKNVISFILPVTVLILIPLWIEERFTDILITFLIPGIIIILLGLYVMILSILTIIRIGKGTIAPWSPANKLIIAGLYSYVRNPLITGVLIVLIGEALAIKSLNIFIWSIVFFIGNNIYFILFEEPGLEKRFGAEYKLYKLNVHRWIPRLKPFKPVVASKQQKY
jgi:protein-S-isoprenylcysteine O-methyltransferase Ste14